MAQTREQIEKTLAALRDARDHIQPDVVQAAKIAANNKQSGVQHTATRPLHMSHR